jgi:hypothetical protein
VVDAQREGAERVTQPRGDLLEPQRPLRSVLDDLGTQTGLSR